MNAMGGRRSAVRAGVVVLVGATLLTACGADADEPASTAPASSTPAVSESVAAAVEGPTVTVGDRTFTVEVATTREQQNTGLSGRPELPEGTGMLFLFEDRSPRTFWMPDMSFDLDIAWIADGVVLGVDTMTPCEAEQDAECERWSSPGEVDAALEVPAGALDGVEPGAPVEYQELPSAVPTP